MEGTATSFGGKGGGSGNEGQDQSQAGGKELKQGVGKQELRNEMGGQPDSRHDSVLEVSLPKMLLLLTADADDHGNQNSGLLNGVPGRWSSHSVYSNPNGGNVMIFIHRTAEQQQQAFAGLKDAFPDTMTSNNKIRKLPLGMEVINLLNLAQLALSQAILPLLSFGSLSYKHTKPSFFGELHDARTGTCLLRRIPSNMASQLRSLLPQLRSHRRGHQTACQARFQDRRNQRGSRSRDGALQLSNAGAKNRS